MSWLPVTPDTIPTRLREQPWVLWRAEPRSDDKPSKVPYRVAAPTRRASSTDASTWGSFDDGLAVYRALVDRPADPFRGPVAGLGVVLVREAGLSCFDLDHVIGPDGQLDPRAETIVGRCDSWTERSPGGRGLHVFVRGTTPRAIRGNQFELYSAARFIAVTGVQWAGTPSVLRDQQ